MPWFRPRDERPGRRLPADIVDRVALYMTFEDDPQNSGIDASTINDTIYQPLFPYASSDPSGFTAELAAAVLPVGGHVVRGGERLVADLIRGDFDDPNYHAMLDVALNWVRSQGVGRMHLTGYEMDRWNQTQGAGTW